MKEGQNLSYVTRIGAYGLAVAAAFAVALAVLLSVSSTSTVEAAVLPATDTADGSVTPLPEGGVDGGAKVWTTKVTADLATFVVSQEDSSASGGFTHGTATNSGQRLTCNDNSDCDKDDADNSIQVELQVDADSPNGNNHH